MCLLTDRTRTLAAKKSKVHLHLSNSAEEGRAYGEQTRKRKKEERDENRTSADGVQSENKETCQKSPRQQEKQ